MKINSNNLIVSIDNVFPNDYNPKLDINSNAENKKQYELILKSLRINGQIDPVLVREIEKDKWEIVNGFHRWTAQKELNYKEIEIKNLGKLSRVEAIKIALSTERPKVPLDTLEESQIIKELYDLGESLDDLPYLEEELRDMLKMLEFNFNEYKDEEFEDKPKKKITCPECGHEFEV